MARDDLDPAKQCILSVSTQAYGFQIKRIGKEELMVEDYAEYGIEYELAPVSAQLAYVQQLQGQTQEAMETYVNMTNKKSGVPSSLVVATTNLISLKCTKDAADGLRKLDQLVDKPTAPNQLQLIESLEFKLSPRQKKKPCILLVFFYSSMQLRLTRHMSWSVD